MLGKIDSQLMTFFKKNYCRQRTKDIKKERKIIFLETDKERLFLTTLQRGHSKKFLFLGL